MLPIDIYIKLALAIFFFFFFLFLSRVRRRRTVSFLNIAFPCEDAWVCFLRYGALLALTTVPPVGSGAEFFPLSTAAAAGIPDEPSALLFGPAAVAAGGGDEPACGKQVTTYATCKAVKTGKSLSSVETGSATRAGNRTVYRASRMAGWTCE